MTVANKNYSPYVPLVLMHEGEYMIRKTFGLFALETNLAKVVESSDITQAKESLTIHPFDLIILGFEGWLDEIHLIELIRGNMTLSKHGIPIIAVLPSVTASQIKYLKQLNVTEIILKPARIKTIQKAFLNAYSQV